MEPIHILSSLAAILGVPIMALIGYQHVKITKLEDLMQTYVTEFKVDAKDIRILEQAKEKVADKFDPIAERLGRIEHQLDQILMGIYPPD